VLGSDRLIGYYYKELKSRISSFYISLWEMGSTSNPHDEQSKQKKPERPTPSIVSR
jgi:hypothetical protein